VIEGRRTQEDAEQQREDERHEPRTCEFLERHDLNSCP
jgi:hypothetical protein